MAKLSGIGLLLIGTLLHAAGGVDSSTLDGKVLFGYQGWFNTPADDAGFGFTGSQRARSR